MGVFAVNDPADQENASVSLSTVMVKDGSVQEAAEPAEEAKFSVVIEDDTSADEPAEESDPEETAAEEEASEDKDKKKTKKRNRSKK